MSTGLVMFLAALAAVIGWGVLVYNRFVTYRNGYQNAFSQIDVQLKRRHDLIPNLVKAAQAYLQHERQTLEAVTAARLQASQARAAAAARPGDAAAIDTLDRSESILQGALTKFFALAEAYPQLRADETVARLTEELTTTENRIGFARQAFNDAATEYNVAVQQVPANVVAVLFAFRPAALLRATRTQAEREPVAVTL
ncbi:MAG TPA: LemA family protein [Burkholderiaceae bacterium]|nr:LemA family protein [Burkholderiaceae bacterium]